MPAESHASLGPDISTLIQLLVRFRSRTSSCVWLLAFEKQRKLVLYTKLLKDSKEVSDFGGQLLLKSTLVDLSAGGEALVVDDAPPLLVHREVQQALLVASLGEAICQLAKQLTQRSCVPNWTACCTAMVNS